MKINEVFTLGLPIRVKLNENFQLDESVDPQTIIQINNCALDFPGEDENCYKLWITLLNEDMPHNISVAKHDWFDKEGQPTLNYFEANKNEKQPSGDYRTFIYVMENEDIFEMVEEPTFTLYFLKKVTMEDLFLYYSKSQHVFYTSIYQIVEDYYKSKQSDNQKS